MREEDQRAAGPPQGANAPPRGAAQRRTPQAWGDHAGRTIAIASDHAGYELKIALKRDLEDAGFAIVDLGCADQTPVDYPKYGKAIADAIGRGDAEQGVLVCGSGIGISISANRFSHIRAALVHDALTARLAREHNDANVICLGAQTTGLSVARDCLRVFLSTPFEGGRHTPRVAMLGVPDA